MALSGVSVSLLLCSDTWQAQQIYELFLGTHKSLYSKGTKGCPVISVIKLHAVIFYVVLSEQILFKSFAELQRCYMVRAKNIN